MPIRIHQDHVQCLADPRARIDLFVDTAGEAARYRDTIKADENGHFTVPLSDIPQGHVITAAATVDGQTSEFNVIAGTPAAPILYALLAQTGPLADRRQNVQLSAGLRRWDPGTRLVFAFREPPEREMESYARLICAQLAHWTFGQITAEVQVSRRIAPPHPNVVIPIRSVPASEPPMAERGGLSFLKWDQSGSFVPGVEILLAKHGPARPVCLPVLAHEIGHALGLHHARVGLLSRMQGSMPPENTQWINDFSAVPTFYDVLALHILYHPAGRKAGTLGQLAARKLVPHPQSAVRTQVEASPLPVGTEAGMPE